MENSRTINEQAMLKVGHTLQMGKYRVEALLSSGGFGNTYVVMNTQFEERWAMKEFFMRGINERDDNHITVSVSNSENRNQFDAQREKFKKEARRLRKLHHPNIVGVEDLFDENGTTYYIMDYIGGGSLSEHLKKNGTFSEQQVLKLLPSLLDALEYVHDQQMWHLDLKPGNILINDNEQPVLIDFGASKQLGLSGAKTTSTGISYTPGYAPLEQVDHNLDRIGPWTDLYALGATIYNVLAKKTPPSVSEIQEAVAEAFEFPHDVSPRMKNLIVWMMTPNRRRRPQSVEDVRNYLKKSQKITDDYEEDEITVIGDDKPNKPKRQQLKQVSKTKPETKPPSNPRATPQPEPEQKFEPQKVSPKERQEERTQKLKATILRATIGILAAACLVVLFFILKSRGNKTTTPQNDPQTVAEAVTATITPATVSDKAFTVRMGTKTEDYSYTGPVDADQQPNGIGKAVYKDGRVYNGPFEHGKLQGKDATFSFTNGDVFKGEFRENMFYRGRYTVKEDGSYFEGTFVNGQPDKGTWYDKNGNRLE